MALISLLCGAIWPSSASATDDDLGAWLIVSSTDAFDADGRPSRWHYWFDAQARYFDLGSGVNQYLIRPGIGYQVGDNLSVWAGYTRYRTRGASGAITDENRYWQQMTWTAGQWGGGTVSMRTRLEQRDVSSGDDVGLVLRHLVRYARPLSADGATTLIIGVEPIVDLRDTDWGGDSGLGQNRLSIGIGWRLTDKVSVETGYMNQYIWADSAEDRSNHLGTVTFKFKLK